MNYKKTLKDIAKIFLLILLGFYLIGRATPVPEKVEAPVVVTPKEAPKPAPEPEPTEDFETELFRSLILESCEEQGDVEGCKRLYTCYMDKMLAKYDWREVADKTENHDPEAISEFESCLW